MRDDFSQAVKRTLSQRVASVCSNPECRASTTGPQTDVAKAVNVGVAAHITGASLDGPRFDPTMSNNERKSVGNGIWLCQNCAKLIDSDIDVYTSGRLWSWKTTAEEEAAKRIGKTNGKARASRSHKQMVAAIKRDLKLRDHLYHDLLKTPSERSELPRFPSRTAKFAHSEIIIHRIDDTSYPKVDDTPGISGWFKLEILDFYNGGLACILAIKVVLLDNESRRWALLPEEESKSSFPPGFCPVKILVTGNIPWRNILHYDMSGDHYYREPHFYCQFADNGEPYESKSYYVVEQGRESELRVDDQVELNTLVKR
jgi:hypothetical protein